MPCATSTALFAQNPKSVTALTGRITKQIVRSDTTDSLAVVREFVGNARAIEDSLTKFTFAKKEIKTLRAQKKEAEDGRNDLAIKYQQCKLDAADYATNLYNVQDKLGRERRRRRWNQVQKWVMVGVSLGLTYLQLRPFLPP